MLIGINKFTFACATRCEGLKDPHATKHVFGWVLNGIVGDCGTRKIFSHFVGLDDKIDNVWDLEYKHCDSKGFSVEDNEVLAK